MLFGVNNELRAFTWFHQSTENTTIISLIIKFLRLWRLEVDLIHGCTDIKTEYKNTNGIVRLHRDTLMCPLLGFKANHRVRIIFLLCGQDGRGGVIRNMIGKSCNVGEKMYVQ